VNLQRRHIQIHKGRNPAGQLYTRRLSLAARSPLRRGNAGGVNVIIQEMGCTLEDTAPILADLHGKEL